MYDRYKIFRIESMLGDDRLSQKVKDTWNLWGKNSKNLKLLDILTCNSANKPSFQNGLLAELQAKKSRG